MVFSTAMKSPHLILASTSPRRRELLAAAGFAFDVVASDADEDAPGGLTPAEVAIRNARAKATALQANPGTLVIGADTVVALGGQIFGKPASPDDAIRTLEALSGRTHEVVTGVAIAGETDVTTFHETTRVTFRELERGEIETYVATGEPMDKAGAYGIQGEGKRLVEGIEGDYDNVVGLPVGRLSEMLGELGVKQG